MSADSSADTPPSRPRNGGDLLVEVLESLGVGAAFGVVSVHNLPLVDALEHRLRWVPTRSEAAAVNATDAYARVRGVPGCAVTSTGTGAANAGGALVEALTAATPVLHLTGQIPSDYLGQGRGVIHETRGQLEMLRACSVWAATVGPDARVELGRAAARLARHPQGPVSLEWPVNLQYLPSERWTADLPDDAASAGSGPDALDEAALDRAVSLIAAAQRPLVWAGGGAVGCRAALADLLTRTGAGLFTSNAGRGVLPETDARVVGNFAASAAGAELLSRADLLVSAGTHFRSNETRSYKLALPPGHIQIDIDPAAIGRAYPASVGLASDAAVILQALLDRLDPSANPCAGAANTAWHRTVADARTACRDQLRRDIGPYAVICDAMAQAMGDEMPRVRDITIPNSSWGNRLLPVNCASTNVCPRGGGIGQAVGMAIGAAIARPSEPVTVMAGDGGLAPQIGELATLAQEQLPVTLVVFDDGGYGVLRNTQDRHLGRRSGVDLKTPDLATLANAFDFGFANVTQADRFAKAFDAALSSGSPQMIRVDCEALGPMPVPFVPPVEVPATRQPSEETRT